MKIIHVFAPFAVALVLAAVPAKPDQESIRALVEGNQEFAFSMYQALSTRDGNLFFSPHSISVALAMTYAGARELTEAQMGDALHFPFGQDVLHPVFAELERSIQSAGIPGELEILTANSLWPHVRYEFEPAFINTIQIHYRSDVFPVDFGDGDKARAAINAWVEDKTHDKIRDLIPPGALDALTRLVLVNAVYFKGKWMTEFRKENTRPLPFHQIDGSDRMVPTMSGKIPARLAEFPGLQVLALPYRGNRLSMVIALPAEVGGLSAVETNLSPAMLADWFAAFREQDVHVYLPVFAMTEQFELNQALMRLGMIDAFDAGRADFSGMDGKRGGLYISQVIHKAFVEVNEEGTEAAAATAVIMRTTSMPRPAPTFRADHPFLFFIMDDQTGAVLFAGRLMEPSTN